MLASSVLQNRMSMSLKVGETQVLSPMTALLAPVFIACSPAVIFCNLAIATSSHVCDAFTDVGLKVATNDLLATDPRGGRADEAVIGVLPL